MSLESRTVRLKGGPRDGLIVSLDFVGKELRCVGRLEDRRPREYEGRTYWAYPTLVYQPSLDEPDTYDYSHTVPA